MAGHKRIKVYSDARPRTAGTMRTIVAFCLALIVSGCLVESEAPLSPQGRLPANSPLLGTWTLVDKDQVIYLHFGNEEATARMLEVEHYDDGRMKSEAFAVSATTVGGNDYLSVQLPHGDRPTYAVVKYHLPDQDTLRLWPTHDKFVADAVRKGLIAGTAETNTLFPRVLLSADSETLRRFVGEHDAQLFAEAASQFRRVR